MLKFQYQSLNLMDEVCTIEVTVNAGTQTIHLFDRDGALYPTYDYKTKTRIANEQFLEMINVLVKKQLISKELMPPEKLIKKFTWIFYSPHKNICKLVDGLVQDLVEEHELDLIILAQYNK